MDEHSKQQNYRSIRSYLEKPIPHEVLNNVLEAAWRGPTSSNCQQVSLVVVQDPERRRQIAEIAGGQAYIAQAPVFVCFVVDFYKTSLAVEVAGEKQLIHESVEGFAVGAVDVGIAMGNVLTAARAAGLGVVPIGGIRKDSAAMVRLLNLPPMTFPLTGVVLGYPAVVGSRKPRLPFESFVHSELYNREVLPAAIKDYDDTILRYWAETGRADGEKWSSSVARRYKQVYFPDVGSVALAQGFKLGQ
ncbi:NADPH-dependent oxidoreductase [Paraburkholderia sp. Ac-20340]|uniref:NADPH-dependent oxidoreductase n=1 Tax=Paraburkholderia sp. Ac-20340 TaxID=2703888 RepID=UPI00197DD210|nr:NADPH-dependent oxidoreductase [Paraburkholderia sp. Ac-20340]MBN3853972.1 NADPH-dependent oxidoreductase [Paraburkholderia sp. Ac-20340]